MKNGCQRTAHPSPFPSTFNPGELQGGTENSESETRETGNLLPSFWPECAEGEMGCVGRYRVWGGKVPFCFAPVLFFLALREGWSLSEGSTMTSAKWES